MVTMPSTSFTTSLLPSGGRSLPLFAKEIEGGRTGFRVADRGIPTRTNRFSNGGQVSCSTGRPSATSRKGSQIPANFLTSSGSQHSPPSTSIHAGLPRRENRGESIVETYVPSGQKPDQKAAQRPVLKKSVDPSSPVQGQATLPPVQKPGQMPVQKPGQVGAPVQQLGQWPTPILEPMEPVVPPTPILEPIEPVVPPTPILEPIKPVVPPTPILEPIEPVVPPISILEPIKPVVPPTPILEPIEPVVPPTPILEPIEPVVPPTPILEPIEPVVPPTPILEPIKPVVPPTPILEPIEPVVPPTPILEPIEPVVPPTPILEPIEPVVPPTPILEFIKPVVPPTPILEPMEPVVYPTPILVPMVSRVPLNSSVPEPQLPSPRQLPRMDEKEMEELMVVAVKLADAAGDIIRQLFRTKINVVTMDDETPMSVAESTAEYAMSLMLSQHFPTHAMYTERSGLQMTDEKTDYVWVMDPINGADSFISGKPLFGTLISVLYKGVPVIGIIDQPILKERWIGRIGKETTLNGVPVSTRASIHVLKDTYMFATSPHLFPGSKLERFNSLLKMVKVPQYGADCYAYGLLAAGHVDLVVEAGLKPYDFLALIPVIEGAGGYITDWQGQHLKFSLNSVNDADCLEGFICPTSGDTEVVATGTAAVHRAALAVLADVKK